MIARIELDGNRDLRSQRKPVAGILEALLRRRVRTLDELEAAGIDGPTLRDAAQNLGERGIAVVVSIDGGP